MRRKAFLEGARKISQPLSQDITPYIPFRANDIGLILFHRVLPPSLPIILIRIAYLT